MYVSELWPPHLFILFHFTSAAGRRRLNRIQNMHCTFCRELGGLWVSQPEGTENILYRNWDL